MHDVVDFETVFSQLVIVLGWFESASQLQAQLDTPTIAVLLAVMASAVHSVAVLKERVESPELGLEAYWSRFVELKMDTIYRLAFACAATVQGVDEASFVEKVGVPILGDASNVDMGALRALHFESYMLAMADLQRWPIT